MNTARGSLGGAGTQTLALAFGGNNSTATELWNGTSWTASTAMATARSGLVGAGTQTAGLGMGGYSAGYKNNTEEFTGAAVATKTITTS